VVRPGWGRAPTYCDQRHLDSAPRSGEDLLDVLMAFHHPTRRWLAELLEIEGPASVGRDSWWFATRRAIRDLAA
jgi:hypothetical protein